MSEAAAPRRMVSGWPQTFILLFAGQSVSLVGSVLTSFAIGVYVFRSTGSVTQFALLNLFNFVPQVVVPIVAGALADRYSRKWLMVICNVGGGLTTLLVALFVAGGVMNIVVAYLATLLFSSFASMLGPAQMASVPQLVPEKHLSRANGLVEFAISVSRFVSPLLGGVLVLTIGLGGIELIDFASYSFAILTLVPLFIPQPKAEGDEEEEESFFREVTDGLRHILPRPGLVGVLLFMAAFNLAAGFTLALANPMVLSTMSAEQLGIVGGAGGLGLLAGSALMTVWSGPKRPIHGLLGVGFAFGLIMALPALGGGRLPFYAAWTFLVTVNATIGNVASIVIWQTKVPGNLQGRVIGSATSIAFSTMLVAFVVAGPLAERVFGPLLMPGGALAGSVGAVIGVGPGRGIAFLLLLAGLFPLLGTLYGVLSPAVRNVDRTPWDTAAAVAEASPA
jgi:DHA3 family macrolide efflux protein-like MFS transporter